MKYSPYIYIHGLNANEYDSLDYHILFAPNLCVRTYIYIYIYIYNLALNFVPHLIGSPGPRAHSQSNVISTAKHQIPSVNPESVLD